jgi:hypothetical protein
MAFTYTVVRVAGIAVGDQVAGWVADGKNSRVFPEPTVSTATYPSTVSKIVTAATPPGASSTDVLSTIYLNDANYNNLPVQFTVNGHGDWIIKATGTA